MTNEKFTDLWSQRDYSGKKVYEWTIDKIKERTNILKQEILDLYSF